MEDGAVVEYDTRARTIPIGNNRGVPERFKYAHPGGPEQPSFRFEFGVLNGIPVCTGVHIEAKEGVPVRTSDLALAHVDKLVISAVGAVAFEAIPSSKQGHRGWRKPHGNKDFNAANVEIAKKVVKGKPRTRSKPDDIDYQLVADTWRNAPTRGKTQAVMTMFICSRATAERRIKEARERGLLDD